MTSDSSAVRPQTRMYELVSSAYAALGEYPRDNVVVYRRNPIGYPDLAALRGEMKVVLDALAHRHRAYGLLMDMRQLPAQLDQPPEFEEEIIRHSQQLETRVARIVVLLGSAAGRMQATRLRREVREASDNVFQTMMTSDEAVAWEFASSGVVPERR